MNSNFNYSLCYKNPGTINKYVFLFALLFDLIVPKNTFSQKIAAGGNHTLVVCNDSTVLSLGGYNVFGQMGNGTTLQNSGCSCQKTPVQVSGLTQIISVAGGGYHSLALKADGTVWAWGANAHGNLGNGTVDIVGCMCKPIPVQVAGLTNVISIAAGYSHSLALRADGTVWAWGKNNWGQLGDSSTISKNIPVRVLGLSNIKSIACATNDASFAVSSDGKVWAWGANFFGQLGDSSTQYRIFPVTVLKLSNIKEVSGGWYHTAALTNDGNVWTWGENSYGTIGNGTSGGNHFTPKKVNNLSGIISISSGSGGNYALKSDGQIYSWGIGWATGRVPDSASYIDNIPEIIPGLNTIVEIIGGGSSTLVQKSDGSVLGWGLNSMGELGQGDTLIRYIPTLVNGICKITSPYTFYNYHATGILYNDSTGDCAMQLSENRLPNLVLIANPGNIYSFTNDSGYYSLGFNDTGSFSITPIVPQQLAQIINNPCPIVHQPVIFNSSTSADTTDINFGFIVNQCYSLKVDVYGLRKRRCRSNFTHVYYWNQGIINADSVTVHVKFDQYDIPLSASSPYIYNSSDNSLHFYIGTLQPGQSGTITIIDSIACIPDILGLAQCTKVWIVPTTNCSTDTLTPLDWDHSSIRIEGYCFLDTINFVIYNDGNDMSSSSQYRIYSNNILSQTGNFQLVSGDSLIIKIVSGGNTIRLEADQSVGYPSNSRPEKSIEACGVNTNGVFSIGYINQVIQDEIDVDIEYDCKEIFGPFDPNEKISSPSGVGSNHIVLNNTPIDYTINFQNTGTDTAFKVVIVDTLSNYFDLATLEFGASSFPYTLEIYGAGIAVLKFTFDNIRLVDSFANEPASHGFLRYKISPKNNLPLGTVLYNTANIYFDFNEAIRTNTNWLTIGNYPADTSKKQLITNSENILCYPNPTADNISIENISGGIILNLNLYCLDGRIVKTLNLNMQKEKINLDLSTISAGVYLLECTTDKYQQLIKIIKY